MKTALVFGATGLVGSHLVDLLIQDDRYREIIVFVRAPQSWDSGKVTQRVIDFDRLADFSDLIRGDELYICLGTTIRQAGSVKRMEEIDRDYPVEIARLAHQNGVERVAVVSSIGADAKSRNYYLRIKGEMEEGIKNIGIPQTIILRPSILLGKRKHFRFGEWAGKGFMQLVSPLLFGKMKQYRGIHAREVARNLLIW